MSTKKSNKKGSVTFDGFGGIDRTRSHVSATAAEDIVNFRILPDGSLSKRCGYYPMSDVGHRIRAYHYTMEGGRGLLYVLAFKNFISIDAETGIQKLLGTVNTDKGNGLIFTYGDHVFVADGEALYRYSDGELTEVKGYVPLIGKEWGVHHPKEVHEPRNILTRKARINYVIPDVPIALLPTKYAVESIDAIYVNKLRYPSDDSIINDTYLTIDISGLEEGDVVDVYLTYKDPLEEQKKNIFNSMSAVLFGTDNGCYMFLGSGNGSGRIFSNEYVDKDNLVQSQTIYPESDDIYFPIDYEFRIGSGFNEVRAITSNQEKLFIFTAGDVWMSYPESAGKVEMPATGISAEAGCSSLGGAVKIDNDIASLGARSVWRWEYASAFPNDCRGKRISEAVDEDISKTGIENCGIFYDHTKRELWVYSRISDEAWIYNEAMNAWYKFDNIGADSMFLLGEKLCFFKNACLYAFDDELEHDKNQYNEPLEIHAHYTTSITDFGSDKLKNLSSLSISGDLSGAPVSVTVETDRGETDRFTLSDTTGAHHSLLRCRANSNRFRYASFKIEADPAVKQRIHGFSAFTR